MDYLQGYLVFVPKNGKETEIMYVTNKKKEINIGSSLTCEIELGSDKIEPIHCKIYLSACGKIKVQNLSKSNPILVNDVVVESTKPLKTDDVITIGDVKLRWELKADAKRRKTLMSREERKAYKSKILKTTRRITMHNVHFGNFKEKTGITISDESLTSSKVEKNEYKDVQKESTQEVSADSEKNIKTDVPVNEIESEKIDVSSIPASGVEKEKENEKTPSKTNRLNLSGVLVTSYTPPTKAMMTRSVSKTPYNTPLRSRLNDSVNVAKVQTPSSANRPVRSMHLVDLTTPIVKRTDSASTPKTSTLRKTPRTAGKTPLRNAILLKSAIKNSSIKKNVQQNTSSITSKGKMLFDSPAKDTSSLIEISLSSVEEVDSSKTSSVYEKSMDSQNIDKNDSLKRDSQKDVISSQSNDEVKELLENISSVLDEENQTEKNGSDIEETSPSQEVEENFNKIVDQQKNSDTLDDNNSIFERPLSNETLEAVDNFDKFISHENLVDENSIREEKDPEKKVESLLKIIESARESLSTEPNKTIQVISSRYSNVTPNDSIVDSIGNTSQKYDVATPKISILGTVASLRNSEIACKLSVSPVSKMSVANDSIEVVENYQLNNNMPKSLRSTRKRIGTAMASLHDISQSSEASFLVNESLNISVNKEYEIDGNQSLAEMSNILSLDDQPQLDSSNKENEPANKSTLFHAYSEFDENNEEKNKIIFEISDGDDNEANSDVDSDSESEDSNEEEEQELDSDEEKQDIDDEMAEGLESPIAVKFRLSQEDLEEEGINPLEISKGEDQLELDVDTANKSEIIESIDNDFEEIPETQQLNFDEDNQASQVANNVNMEQFNDFAEEDHEEIPATQPFDVDSNEIKDDSMAASNSEINISGEAIDNVEKSTVDNEEAIIDELESETKSNIECEEPFKDVELDQTVEMTQSQPDIEEHINESVEDLASENDDSKIEHEEIPATQAFEFDGSFEEEHLDETNDDDDQNMKDKSEVRGSVIELADCTVVNSQEVNKSDTLSIQEISDATISDVCSQESNLKKVVDQEIDSINDSNEVQDAIETEYVNNESASESQKLMLDEQQEIYSIKSDEIINKSVVDDNCATTQESKESLTSINTNISDTINELISTTTDDLTEIASIQQYATSEIMNDDNEIQGTQNDFEVSEKSADDRTEEDSAIESCNNKTNQSNEEEKHVDDSALFSTQVTPIRHRESALFSDTEMSHVELSTIIKGMDSDESPTTSKSIVHSDNIVELESTDSPLNIREHIRKEFIDIAVNFEDKIEENCTSILPSDNKKRVSSSEAMISEEDTINNSFEELFEKQKEQQEENKSQTEEVQCIMSPEKEIEPKIDENFQMETSINDLSDSAAQYMEIEMQLAKMNEEPQPQLDKERPRSMLPISDIQEGDKNVSNRLTMIPSTTKIRQSFIDNLEEEKNEKIIEKHKKSQKMFEEKPKLNIEEHTDNDIAEQANDAPIQETKSDEIIAEENKIVNEPVIEEVCIKKNMYITTDNEKQVLAPETPSRRRVARVNYSELATGSPARSRRGRSVSTESNGKEEEPKPLQKCVKMESIVEDDISLEITAKVTEIETETEVQQNQKEIVDVTENTDKQHTEMITETQTSSKSENADHENDVQEEEIYPETQTSSIPEIADNKYDDKVQTEKVYSETHEESKQLDENIIENTKNVINQDSGEKFSEINEENVIENEVSSPEKNQQENESENIYETKKEDENKEVPFKIEIAPKPVETIIESQTPSRKRAKKNNYQELATESIQETNKNVPSKIEIAPKATAEALAEPETPSRRRAKKLNYQELASGSPARTPRRGRAASVEEKPVENPKITKPEIPPTIQEEEKSTISESPGKVIENKELEVKAKSSGRARKIDKVDQLKLNVEDVSTPSKRAKRGVTPINPIVIEPEKKGRTKRQEKVKEVEESNKADQSDAKVIASVTISSTEQEAPKLVAKRGRGKQPKVVEQVNNEDKQPEVHDETAPAKRGRAKKIKDEPLLTEKVDDKIPEKAETPKKGRGRKAAEEVPQEKHIDEKVEELPIAKKSRKRLQDKTVDSVIPQEPEIAKNVEEAKEVASPELPVKKRGRPARIVEKVVEQPQLEEKSEQAEKMAPKRGRKAKADVVPEIVEPVSEPIENTTPKKQRKTKEDEIPKDEPLKEEVVKRGRKNKVEEITESRQKSEEPTPLAKRGRKLKADLVVQETQPEIVETAPKRGRKAAKVEHVQETVEESPKKGRKGKTEVVAESNNVETQPETVQVVAKKGRGRKNKAESVEAETIVISSQSTQEVEPKEVIAKRVRGRQAKIVKETETKTDEKEPEEAHSTKRGKTLKRTEVETESTSDQPAKKTRGKATKEPEVVSNDVQKEEKSSPIRAKTPSKRKVGKKVTIVTPSSMPTHSKELKTEDPKATKRATKRQAPIAEEESAPTVSKRPTTRTRK